MDNRKLEKIKKIYENDFGKELKEQELLSLLKKLQGNNSGKIEEMPLNDLYLIYSPLRILPESQNITKKVGKNNFDAKEKYKKLKELLLVSVLSLSFNKYNLGKWYIKSNEAPDIKLHKFDSQTLKGKRGFFQYIEIMFIVERITSEWSENIEAKITDFIKNKKFLKSYGHNTSLFIAISFNKKKDIKFNRITQLFLKDKVPFRQIWILCKLPEKEKEYKIFEVYPRRNDMTFNFDTDQKYFF